MPRIALAQIDVTVGDIDGNSARIARAIADARQAGAQLVLIPELALAGYPPEDLLGKDHFVDDIVRELHRLAEGVRDIVAVVGFVQPRGRLLHNAAAVIRDGRVDGVYLKRRLPNYGVFDEHRYFDAGDAPYIFELDGMSVAVTICEDVWVPDLAAEAAGAGADLLVNISASPYHLAKGREREEMLVSRASDNGLWVAYCNLVGGQDELVFDGRSLVVSPDGAVVGRARSFAEDLLVCDIPPKQEGPASRVEAAPEGDEEVFDALVLGMRDYLGKNGFSDVVIGLSGGVDSSLVAALATEAIGKDHVHAVTMPSRYSSTGSVKDAIALCENLGIECMTLPIEAPFSALLEELEPLFAGREPDIAEENLQARVRGTMLMALSNKFGWIVLATGNKSELSVGYSTLYGDMVGGFAPIKDLYKTRVYSLVRWINRASEVIPASTVEKPPSAELRPGQLDTDSLPPYEVLDEILHAYIEQDASIEEIVSLGFDEELVYSVSRMVDAAEYKRRQGPVGIRVTPKAFGKDRRMPITNRYRG